MDHELIEQRNDGHLQITRCSKKIRNVTGGEDILPTKR